jgi:hypothetical protein
VADLENITVCSCSVEADVYFLRCVFDLTGSKFYEKYRVTFVVVVVTYLLER